MVGYFLVLSIIMKINKFLRNTSNMTCCLPLKTSFHNITYTHFIFRSRYIPTGAGPLSCTSCPTHFMLEGGLCTECLSMQFYDSLTQTCKTCHESCRSCSGPGQYSCVTCAFPLHLDRLNNQCVPCCATDATPEDQSCCHCDKNTGTYMLGSCWEDVLKSNLRIYCCLLLLRFYGIYPRSAMLFKIEVMD